MSHLQAGDCVLVINATYEPRIIGRAGIVERPAEQVSGVDRYGRVVAGVYVVVDLPDDVNRHGTTLWYLKPEYLLKLGRRDDLQAGTGAGSEPDFEIVPRVNQTAPVEIGV